MYQVKSIFYETPCRRTVRIQDDFTTDKPATILTAEDVLGAHVRYDVTVWQDEVGNINKKQIEENLITQGALSVDIRIIRVPRVTVRNEAVLKAVTLRDKIKAWAESRGESVEWSVLSKADLLETVPIDELMERVAGGAT